MSSPYLCTKKYDMNKNDMELLKNSPSMLKGIAVQAERLNGTHNLSLPFRDVFSMSKFGLALGCQISEADNVNTDKLIAECIIGGALFGAFIALVAANCAKL